ncbi:MAG TPA: DNA translocase FtsK 4TM domain-containing protein [Patescibacteria group bacterium]|nr:DNA translocase FtsK 4TM domain-containing protein [Patescibacteria group bacterium]
MSRRHHRHSPRPIFHPPAVHLELHPDTGRGIAVVLLFACAAFLFLSFLGLAGTAGETLNHLLQNIFGWDRWIVPAIFLGSGTAILFPHRIPFRFFKLAGGIVFFLSFNALLNLFSFRGGAPVPEALAHAGGLVGQLLAAPLVKTAGFWGGTVVLLTLVVVSLLFTLNLPLRRLLIWPVMAIKMIPTVWKKLLIQRKQKTEGEEEGDQEEWTENTASTEPTVVPSVEAGILENNKAFKTIQLSTPAPLPEKALTTRRRRKASLPLDLLEYRTIKANSGDVDRNREIIRRLFNQFHIQVEMSEVSVGPTVTQYTLRPSEGIKLSRVVALQNDLALALAAHPIRIEAPIPGKSLVGIEVPNQSAALVSLREILESKAFRERKSDLTVALGKDVTGRSWTAPLEKMPHLLVAGATGSGKSVCLNAILVSLLYENGPDDLRLILVDPKRVELTTYEGVPHLLVPPIIKTDETINALKWTVREMDRRLDVLSKFKARDIASYNERAEERMPRIVVVIDELADLMVASGHEAETTIVRIAQMARAVGIHLILATQRPSVDVITGLIKANFPARIAFAVASQTDSRTILDCAGAEKLLGRGDMLYSCAELSKPQRVQGAYVSESEIRRVVEALKQETNPDYNYAITASERSETVLGGASDTHDDPLLREAAAIAIQAGRASTSLLQRRLKVGYGRAARLLDILEEHGVVGPPDGSKPREILVSEWPQEDSFDFSERQESLSEENDSKQKDDEEQKDDELQAFLDAQEGTYSDPPKSPF